MMKDNGKTILRLVDRYGSMPDYLQENIGKLYKSDFDTRHLVRKNSNIVGFIFLEELSKKITTKFREDANSEKERTECIFVFSKYDTLYCVQSNFKSYGSDLYTEEYSVTTDYTIFSASDISMMLGLRDRYSIRLNEEFIKAFESKL